MIERCMRTLKQYKKYLSRQQVTTFKGQILSGDYNGFRTGLWRIINKKIQAFSLEEF